MLLSYVAAFGEAQTVITGLLALIGHLTAP